MRRLLAIFVLVTLAGGIASAAGRDMRRGDYPNRYAPRSLDGQIVQVTNDVDGRSWSAWAYRNGGEYDLAVSVSATPGVWSDPQFIGINDGVDQGAPAFAVDERGNTYLAYADSEGNLSVRALRPGSSRWSTALGFTDARGALASPNLLIAGSALVLGFRLGDSVEMLVLPLVPLESMGTASIYDGPDPTGGRDDDDEDEDPNGFSLGEEPDEGFDIDLIPYGGYENDE